ncbi:MAG TPA: Cys-tRNA(Pro) deacylase [Ignavibacteria bacterium]|nr:Cys-tRNA(Pro) deacylase [Ignavibacteria bacterium]
MKVTVKALMKKTNAIRILESLGIKFETAEYEFTEDEIDAISVAKKIEASGDIVFKTLVTHGDKTGITVFCIPAEAELNLKKAAAASGNKKIEMVHVKELLPLTGYIRGGCSPVGMTKKYPTYIEETAQMFEMIFVSAGTRGMQVKISPADLAHVTEAEFSDLI